ncbi:hypothetical protein C2E23DRAFT_743815, partial [Lenzites betulinus]
EELVLNMQGFLVQTNLPPLWRNQIPANTNHLIDLRQSVTLTGLGSEQFENATLAMLAIYHRFQTYLAGYMLRPWQPERTHNHLAVSFGNRYLTSAKFAYLFAKATCSVRS